MVKWSIGELLVGNQLLLKTYNMWSDSHAHLFDLNNREFTEEIKNIEIAKISNILNLGTDISTSVAVKEQIKSYNSKVEIFGGAGVCAAETSSISNDNYWLDKIEELSISDRIIAIGEVGIDGLNKNYGPFNHQLEVFTEQLMLAKKLNLPLSIHSRGAEEKALEICKKLKIEKAVFHCYTGSTETAINITNAGFYISLSGIVTFKNSDFDFLITAIPSNKLLIETDSPYLAPVPNRGKRNSPAYIPFIGNYCSSILNREPTELAEITTQNFKRLFLS